MKLNIFKIGGNVVDNSQTLEQFLDSFCRCQERKILVHGGGALAARLAEDLDIPVKLYEGRRITDEATLRITVMVYAGWINKTLTASLASRGCRAMGLSGVDGFCIPAVKRSPHPVDFGYVGDINPAKIHVVFIQRLLEEGLVPVFAPITCDRSGQLLNTNADTIASSLALALKTYSRVSLHYIFDKEGIYGSNDSPEPLPMLSKEQYLKLRSRGVITGGMIPKIETALQALSAGVEDVTVGTTGIRL